MINFLKDCHSPEYFLYFHSVNENAEVHRGGAPLPIVFDKIVINHYQLKSKEEYLNKCRRGNAINFKSAGIYNEERFLASDHNEVFDDGILKYRAARAKVYQPPDNSNAKERVLGAVKDNLSRQTKDMETLLTCREMASYFQEKALEEAALVAVLKSLDKMSLSDAQLLIRELVKIMALPYPVVEELRAELFKRIPKIITEIRSRSHFKEFFELYHLQDLALALLKPKE